jgi:L-ascorbate metabolism protein UlaG (beta-lactamase superfamily)
MTMTRHPGWALLLVAVVLASGGCTGFAGVDRDTFPEPQAGHITYWGHACMFIDVDGVGIVTDPVFEKNLWNRRRFVGIPAQDALQRTQVVLVSHAHNDHLSPSTLAMFPKDAIVLCPAPVAKVLEGRGLTVKAMEPGEEHDVGGVRFIATAVHHPGGRWSMHAAADGRALGFVIVAPSATIFYSGDTDYNSSFDDVGWTYSPDVAILNINGHLKPPAAARAARGVGAPIVIPAHWGAYTYWLIGGNRRPHGEDELKRLLDGRLRILEVGESTPVPGPRMLP